MPKKNIRNKKSKPRRIARPEPPRKTGPSTSRSIFNGISDVANSIIPGVGPVAKGVADILGWGAYRARRGGALQASPVPMMSSNVDEGVRIVHHEFLGDISSSTTFTNTVFQINPGVAATFPWLSQIAHNFQKYEMRRLVFYFKSTSAVALNSLNTALGTLIGATQYNNYESEPISKVGILNIAGACDGKPAEDNVFAVECAPEMRMYKNMLVRAYTPSDDIQKYDLGKFNLAAVGSQASAVIGELHVVYDVILKQAIPASAYVGASSAAYTTDTGVDATHPMGTVAMTMVHDYIGLGFDIASNSFVLPAGTGGSFVLSLLWYGSTPGVLTYPTVSLSNVAGLNIIAGTSTMTSPSAASTSTKAQYQYAFRVLDTALPVSCVIGIGGTLATDNTTFSLLLTSVNPSVVTLATPSRFTYPLRNKTLCLNEQKSQEGQCVEQSPEEDTEQYSLVNTSLQPPILPVNHKNLKENKKK